ncbi:hypothetical protein M9Y10_013322 [Tritrichomonas musculus]|uniref:Protein kinase domain-containing protein n=1 Tax=Tritrichomonas musculus TaxID=1915356 RepID=A0ABR2GKF7_9EUKA
MNLKTPQSKLLNQFKIDINNMKNPVQINSGSFGIVYLVQDKTTDEYYEAKVLNYHKDSLKYRQSIVHEIEILIHVQHPSIVKFRGYSEKDFEGKNNITIIMDYPSNGSLANAIKNPQNLVSMNKYDNTARQIILVGIARGMMHLHRYHIVNPCLKPDNILLDEFLKPYITNFGLSKFFERNHSQDQPTQTKSLIYNAPEVLSKNHYNSRSDVYSFGILMYEVITESKPFPLFQEKNAMTINQFKENVVRNNYRPEFKSPIKKSFQNLIERCWSNDYKKRPTFEEIFNKLAFNIENSIYDIFTGNGNTEEEEKEENKYYLDNVDIEKLQAYIDEIDVDTNIFDKTFIEELQNKLKIVEKNNLQLKKQLEEQEKLIIHKKSNAQSKKEVPIKEKSESNMGQITIENFNNLTLKSQQSLIGKIIKSLSNDNKDIKDVFTNLNNLLIYIEKLDKSLDSIVCFQIMTHDPNDNSLNLIANPQNLKRIYLLSTATDILHSDKPLDSASIRAILNPFTEVFIEIKYPSDTFKEIYDDVSNLKTYTKAKIKIAFYINKIHENDEFYKIKKNFNLLRIGSDIKIIPRNAFIGYSSLTKVIIPSTVTAIEDNAFKECKSLVEITIPNSVKTIGNRCFHECLSLQKLIFPSSVISIGASAFRDCYSLDTVELSSSLNSIEDSLFSKCSSLSEIAIPSSVTKIGDNAFTECSSLSQIIIPSSVKFIGKNAFDSCSSLSQIAIPSSVVQIGWNAFFGCSSLSQISIPSSVEEIKYNIFDGCFKLKKIVIDPYKTVISPHTFESLQSLNHLIFADSVTSIKYNYFLFQRFTRITIPSSVKTIDKNAFSNCKYLRYVDMSSSIITIGDSAFFDCASLLEIEIPSSVKSIGASAFLGCSSLTQITIPSSVTLIGKNAFYGCTSLLQIQILSSYTSIGDSAFQGCSSLKQITINSPVNSIGSGAFSGCSSLLQIQIPYAISSIANSQKYQFLGIDKKVQIITI